MDKKSMVAALIGHALERYDVVLYGFFASMLTPIFFPENDMLSLFSSMGTFAAGYLMRPFGGIVFGILGDKYGRKQAFMWSIMLVVLPTLVMGLLPTYEQIGLAAPLLLIFCRLMQGFCAGGEFSGAAIFIGEHTLEEHAGLSGSFVCAVGFFGVALGTTIGSFTTSPFFPEWGWRIPFLIGSFLTLMSYFLRKKMYETPDFIRSAQHESLLINPLREIFKYWKKSILYAGAIGACGHIYLYTTTVYMNNIYKNTIKISSHYIIFIDTLLVLYWLMIVLLMGFLSDKLGVKKLMAGSALSVFFIAYPVFFYFDQDLSVERLFISQITLITFCAGFFGPATALFKELFPTEERYTGIAFGITLGQALLGGTTPLIEELLVTFTQDQKTPAFYVMFGSAIALLSLLGMTKIELWKKKSVLAYSHKKEFPMEA